MSANKQLCWITGNLTRDAELKGTKNAERLLVFNVASTEEHFDKASGEIVSQPNYFECILFGTKRADALARYLKKGTYVSIDGRLRWRQWEANGEKRSTIEVVVSNLEFAQSAERPRYAKEPDASEPELADEDFAF